MIIQSIMRVMLAGAAALMLVSSVQHSEVQAQAAKAKEKQTTAQQLAVPDAYKMDMLIRTVLIALSQANLTGNYTVLRDLGSPSFQAVNSAAQLSDIFRELRQRRLDFSPILFFNPKLVRQPAIDESGRLRLTGFLDTRPERINFDMMFELVGSDWRLFGIAVQMQPAPAATAASESNQAPAKKEKGTATKEATKAKAATKTEPPPKQ